MEGSMDPRVYVILGFVVVFVLILTADYFS